MSASFTAQAMTVTRRDLLRERRSGEVAWVTLPFGAVALLLVPIAIGTDTPTLRSVGIGMFWVVVMLFGVLIAVRRTTSDSVAQRDMVALTGMDPAAAFVGTAVANFVLLVLFEVVLGVLTVVLYDVELTQPAWIPVIMLLVAAGLSLLGTIAAGIVATGRSTTALVPLIVAPMSVPLLIAATQSFEGLRLGKSILAWILMLVVISLVLAIAGILSARALQETG
ncbi:MAG: heme exporter protein CcmB [Acidimicrobiia bacterium]